LISLFVTELGLCKAFEAMLPTLFPVFSFFPMVMHIQCHGATQPAATNYTTVQPVTAAPKIIRAGVVGVEIVGEARPARWKLTS
jgi:hypothetical protein